MSNNPIIERVCKEFDKEFDVETSGRDGNEYFSACHACEMSPHKIKSFFTTSLTLALAEQRKELERLIEERRSDGFRLISDSSFQDGLTTAIEIINTYKPE